jgi:hypothetical protein
MPDFYILGSKWYRDEHYEDRLPDMVKHMLLEVGWGGDGGSFASLYGKPETEIVEVLKARGEPPPSYNTHKLFLNLRPGDWVAIKKEGAPKGKKANLVIKGFARVTQRQGIVYFYRRKEAAHCVHAKFLEHEQEYHFPFGYGATIHRLSNRLHIRRIFAPVLGKHAGGVRVIATARRAQWHKKAALLANVEDQTRKIRAEQIKAQQTHHRIRNKLFKKLVRENGEQCVALEQDWIDLQVQNDKGLTLYEVKPYSDVVMCVREALGQILTYAWRGAILQPHKLRLVVVGPKQPGQEETEFIRFVKRNLKIGFDYLPFK